MRYYNLKTLTYVVPLSLMAASCGANEDYIRVDPSLCIPINYAVTTRNSALPSTQLDPDSDSDDVSIYLPPKELADAVPGYLAETLIGERRHQQALYVMIGQPAVRILESTATLTTLPSAANLYKAEAGTIAWQVAENRKDTYVHWGHCSHTFVTEKHYDCLRDLQTENYQLTYTIDALNLHLYKEIDAYLRSKASLWKCADN